MFHCKLILWMAGATLLSFHSSPSAANYADLDDQSGGITSGFGAWGAYEIIKEPSITVADQGIITVYHPDGDEGPLPTVFFISGWGREAETYEKFFDFLVSHHYTVVNIYNFNPGSINTSYPNALAMIEHAADQYSSWIDTGAVGLMGHSYGGGSAIWLGQRVFGDLNWGQDGKRFILTTAPWLTFLTTRADLEAYPSGVKLQIQINYDDVTSNPDFQWNTDPRAIRAVFELINIPSSQKDLITVHSDLQRSYQFNGNTYHYDADHYLCYTGAWGGVYEPYDELDVYALNRLSHAMLEYVFQGNLQAKEVALGNGGGQQTDMGLLPALTVSDTPVITRDENLFLYRCSDSDPEGWGDPAIWKLQEFCEDTDGDGIIDELEGLSGVGENDLPLASLNLGVSPNPFNPRTSIGFYLAEPTLVSLNIYNVDGALVRTLVREQLYHGQSSVQWNGRDDQGMTLSSGLYFARLRAGEDFSSISMALIR